MKQTPFKSKVYLLLAAFFLLLPSALKLYSGETQRLIVASGKINDPNFSETVVFIVRHTIDGAFGLVVNRPLTAEQKKSAPAFLADKGIPLYSGGPVEFPEHVIVLEKMPPDDKGQVYLKAQLFDDMVKEDPQVLDKIVTSIKGDEQRYRVYLGHSGWGFLQMHMEFFSGAWASTKLDPDLIFSTGDPKEVWEKAMAAATAKRPPRNPGTI